MRHLIGNTLIAAFAGGCLAWSATGSASCGTAFCTLNTQWETQGVWTEPGTRLDLRFEYIDQDQPRSGRRKVAVGEIPRHHDEVRTLNRNGVATLSRSTAGPWGWSVQVPVVDRSHSHIHHHHGAQLLETWNFTELGDARVHARYQFSGDAAASGMVFGLKLPTGKTDKRNAEGLLAERTLQPGTGTTDGILGFYHNRKILLGGRPAASFVQGQAQIPFNEHDHYKPGNQYSIDLGMDIPLSFNLSALLQANFLLKTRDKGTEAEPEDTGGAFAWLSPGMAYALARQTRLYGFVQLPLYQRVNGVQLTADWAAAVGMSRRF